MIRMSGDQHDLMQALQGLEHQINQRFDDQRIMSDKRHDENVRRLEFIVEQTSKTNGRVTLLEHLVQALKDDFQGIRKRWHDFRESLQDDVRRKLSQVQRVTDNDAKPITRREVTIAIAVGTIIVTIMIWIFSRYPLVLP